MNSNNVTAEGIASTLLPEPSPRHIVAITVIKSIHTLIFLGMGSCVVYIFYSGLANRVSRLTKVSLAVVGCESLIFFGNGRR